MRFIPILLLTLFFPLFVSAKAEIKSDQIGQCVPASEMSEIARDFSQFRKYSGQEYCFNGSNESNLLTGIYFMRKTSFAQNMDKSSDELFSGRFASDWYGYFTQRVKNIKIDSGCPKRVGAYVYPWGSTMYVCTFMLSDIFTGLDRASVFMHEARHLDGYPHTTCSSGARAGLRGACDTRISDGGSYAVSVETYAQLARYAQNIHPALRAYSRASAVVYADEAFQYPAQVERENHFLVLTKDKRFHSLDLRNGTQTQQLGMADELGHIIMRAQMMVMIPDDKSLPAKYIFAKNEGAVTQQPGTTTEEYNKASPAERANLLDMHIAAVWDARVFTDNIELSCDPRSERRLSVDLQGETPVNILYLTGYAREKKFVHLQMESGKIYKLGCQSPRNVIFESTQRMLDRVFKRIHRSGAHYLGVGFDGLIYEIDSRGRSAPISTAFDGEVHELVPMQSYMFFDQH